MTVEITALQALEYLARAVNDKGADFAFSTDDESELDTGCQYYELIKGEDATPCCIVGHVFEYAGLRSEFIIENHFNQLALFEFAGQYDGELKLLPGAELILSKAQNLQDTGSTWGEAYRGATETYMSLPEELR